MSENPVVTIENGTLKGSIETDYQGKSYYSFQGIPYAKAPIGELRFKPPQPAESWSGTRDATKEGDSCYSKHMITKTYVGSEDCLFLNVYTSELSVSKNALKPVMFWIHGGGYVMGSGDSEFYGPHYLISEDIVLVTINYRLGLLGFLSFDDVSLGITGNGGLKDQVMALKWVNKNIACFGGNPNNVTIFGESAGGSSVHYLILSPLATGLFHNAILQSGTAFSLWARGQKLTSAIATVLGIDNAKESEICKILQNMSVDKLLELQEKIPDPFDASLPRMIGPVIENEKADAPLLIKNPTDIIRSGKYNHVPIMIGFTSREGMLYEIDTKRLHGEVKFTNNFETFIPCDLNIPKNSELSKRLADKIKCFYYGSEEPSLENIDQCYLIHGDNFFVYSIYNLVKQHIITSDKPIFLYRMSVESKLNIFKRFGQITNPGACHGDDIGYLFTNSMTIPLIPNSKENISMKRFIKLWTTFAKNGNPNPVDKDDLINVNWKPVETKKFHYLNIGDHLTVGFNAEQERMNFWDEIYAVNFQKCNL